jgi:hypothetical protein
MGSNDEFTETILAFEQVGDLVGHLQLPVMAGLQLPIDVLLASIPVASVQAAFRPTLRAWSSLMPPRSSFSLGYGFAPRHCAPQVLAVRH